MLKPEIPIQDLLNVSESKKYLVLSWKKIIIELQIQ